jgi:hypothetical protein
VVDDGAGAAVDAGDRMALEHVGRSEQTDSRGVPQSIGRYWLRRGPQRPDRISLGERKIRSAAGDADLVGRGVALIVTSGGEPPAFAAKAATATIPIVMMMGSDPVTEGLVVSLNRPGANATGATVYAYNMESKRLGLLHEAVPAAKTIAVLVNPTSPAAELQTRDVQEAAPRLGVEVVIFNAHGTDEFESLFAAMAERKAGARRRGLLRVVPRSSVQLTISGPQVTNSKPSWSVTKRP